MWGISPRISQAHSSDALKVGYENYSSIHVNPWLIHVNV